MFRTVRNNDLIVLQREDYIEVEILSKHRYPFIEISVVRRDNLENDGPPLTVFTTAENGASFEVLGRRIIFKVDSSFMLSGNDYFFMVTGIEADGSREKILSYVISIRHR